MSVKSSLAGNSQALPFPDWMRAVQLRIEATLSRRLPPAEAIPARLHQAMRYACLDGGKRIRPLLVFAAGELNNGSPERLENVASAVEMIHAYSLVHDDLPCMDDDVLRRGRPTCHVEYDESTALLVGDSLQALAFELLARAESGTESGTEAGNESARDVGRTARQLEMVRLLARASGSCGMAGGQAIDLGATGQSLNLPQLELMHALKTGALIRAAVMLGALCGDALSDEASAALDRFAKRTGLLFQVVDDILDCTASTATLGKTAGKDAVDGKPTYVSLLGVHAAREFADDLSAQALAALAVFGERGQRLVELTHFITQRKF